MPRAKQKSCVVCGRSDKVVSNSTPINKLQNDCVIPVRGTQGEILYHVHPDCPWHLFVIAMKRGKRHFSGANQTLLRLVSGY